MNRHYQSKAPFNWLRTKVFKIEKPYALGWNLWDEWDITTKREQPIGYFFTETFPKWLEWIPEHSIDYLHSFRYTVINWFEGSHRLNSTLDKGKYHEFSERMLYSLFDSYVDYIEIEEAHMHVVFAEKAVREKYNIIWWKKYPILRWFSRWRCAEAAIDHLKWEMSLDTPNPNDPSWQSSPYQAEKAREKMALYTWWKHVRPSRGESWDVSGINDFIKKMDAKYGKGWDGHFGSTTKLTPSENRNYHKLQTDNTNLEEAWENEDEEMMIRLIRLRKNLWT